MNDFNTYDASGQERTDLSAQHAARDRYRFTADGPDIGDAAHEEMWAKIDAAKEERRKRWEAVR